MVNISLRVVLFVCIWSPCLAADHLVIGLDLSKSENLVGHDGETEWEKNVEAVALLIQNLAPGTHFSVIGITEDSVQPWVLLAGTLPEDHGPLEFIDRVAVVRQDFAARLRRLMLTVKPRFDRTDILGAVILAADVLCSPRDHRTLVLFTDGRHHTADLDLESPPVIDVQRALVVVERRQLMADLHGVEVRVYGVHDAGKSVLYWHSLRDFWAAYFHKVGATLETFSVTREVLRKAGSTEVQRGRGR